MLDNSVLIPFAIWAIKEAYQSFYGSRMKTLDALDSAQKKIIVLECDLKLAMSKIDDVQSSVNFLKNIKREYR